MPSPDNQTSPDNGGLPAEPSSASAPPPGSTDSTDASTDDSSNTQSISSSGLPIGHPGEKPTEQTTEPAPVKTTSAGAIEKTLVSTEEEELITPEVAENLGRAANAMGVLKGVQTLMTGGGLEIGALLDAIDLGGSFAGPPGIAIAAALNIIVTLYEILSDSEKRDEEEAKAGDNGVLQSMKSANAKFVRALQVLRAIEESTSQAQETQIATYKDRGDVQQQQAYLDDEFSIAAQEDQYQQDEGNPNLSDEQRRHLTENFSADTQSRRDKTAVQMAETDSKAKAMKLSGLQNLNMTQENDIGAANRRLTFLSKTQKDAQDSLKKQNLKIDENGKIINPQGGDELERLKKEIDATQLEYDFKHSQSKNAEVISPMASPDGFPAIPNTYTDDQLQALLARLTAEKKSYEDLQSDARNSNLKESIQTAQVNLAKAVAAQAATKARIEPAEEQANLAYNRERLVRFKQVLDEKQRQIDDANETKKEEEEKQKKLRTARDNDLEAKRLVLQAQLQRDPNNADLQKQMADLKDQAAQNYEADQSGVQIPEPTLQPRPQDDKNPKLQWILNLIAGLETEKKRNQHDPAAVANIDNQIGQLKGQLDSTIYNASPTVSTPDQLVQQSVQDKTAAQVLLNHPPPAATQTPKETSGSGTQADPKELSAAAQALEAASHSNAELAANLKGILEKAQGLENHVAGLAQATSAANAEMGRRILTVEAAIASLKNSHH